MSNFLELCFQNFVNYQSATSSDCSQCRNKFCVEFGMSLMQSVNNIEPRTDPCGTPSIKALLSLKLTGLNIRECISVKCHTIKVTNILPPCSESFIQRMQHQSLALLTSVNLSQILCWLSLHFRIRRCCTHLKTMVIMFMMSNGHRFTQHCLLQLMEWEDWTFGISTRTLRFVKL